MSSTTTRLATTTLSLALGAGSLLAVTAAPAHAAWLDAVRIHGGKVQICKDTRRDGTQVLRARLNNNAADHTHLGGVSRTRDGNRTDLDFRAAAGDISDTKTLIRRPGDTFSAGIGELDGRGAGGSVGYGSLPRC